MTKTICTWSHLISRRLGNTGEIFDEHHYIHMASLGAQTVKNLPAMWETEVQSLNQEDRLVREGNGNPPQYSCLENPMDGGAWWATVHVVARSQT